MSVIDGDLIAAGEFSSMGGVPAHGIARWNGAAWIPMGEAIPRPAAAVARLGAVFVAAGPAFFARFGCVCWPNCNNDTDAAGAPILDGRDIRCFIQALRQRDPYADCNADGLFDLHDFACFRERLLQGCP